MISSSITKKRIQKLNLVRLGFFILIFSSLMSALFVIKGLFITLLLAFVISFALLPPVNWLCKKGLSRGLSASLVFLSTIGGLAGLIVWAFPFLSMQFNRLRTEFPIYIEKTIDILKIWQLQMEKHFFFMKNFDLSSQLNSFLSYFSTAFLQDLPSTLAQSFTVLLLAPFFAYYMTKNEIGLVRYIYPLVPNQLFEMFLSLHYKISKQIGVFIRGRLLEALIVGTIVGSVLIFFKFPFAILLAVFAGTANLIPYVGPIVASIFIFLVALVNNYEAGQILIVLGIFYFTQFIDSMVLVPILLARIVNLHPLTVIVIIIAGAQFMGVLGMVISIPVANALKVSVMAIYQHVTDNI